MSEFIALAFYLCISAVLLVALPVMRHPTLPRKRKRLICLISFIIFVPVGLTLYAWLGVPDMAATR